ncbi:hypothetical protein [Helicobacter typhlonius]|uniref:hypothetical protein n=1 Tax=Helicobacter typhlonius TaxID=76936 RepID=UPI002FE35F7F
MLNKIAQIAATLKNTQTPTTYNAALPILIKIIAKLKGDMYLLQIGAQRIETKSHKQLNVGERYWGEMGRSSLGHITLKNLIAQPKIIDMFANAPLKLSLQNLQDLGKQSDIFSGFKDFLSQKLADSVSKDEFIFLGNLLLGLEKNVLSLVISEKDEVLQMKRVGTNKVRFSAIMPSLGIIEGEINIAKGGNALSLKVMYESTKILLEQNFALLKGFAVSSIVLDSALKPLYEFQESLLDVRG